MLYIAYDTPTSKCSCLSTILKIKAILAEFCIRYTTTVMPLISFVFSSWIINEYYNLIIIIIIIIKKGRCYIITYYGTRRTQSNVAKSQAY